MTPSQRSSALNCTRRRFLLTLGSGIAGVSMGCKPSKPVLNTPSPIVTAAPSSTAAFSMRTGHALGTTVKITIESLGGAASDLALDRSFALIDELEDVLSIYRPHSQLSQLNSAGVLHDADPRLLEVLETAQGISDRSSGAFDVTVQPLWNLFASAHQARRLPDEHELAAVLPIVDYRCVERSGTTVRLRQPETPTAESPNKEAAPLRPSVTLNGIAQGYVLDQVRSQLRDDGVANALIDTGELGTLGEGKSGPWRLGIQHPHDPEALAAICPADGRCIATSGGYATRFTADGIHHHLLDPRTGSSPLSLASATVVAPSGILADALSTAIFVMGVEQGLKLIESMPGTDAYLITNTTSARVLKTSGFPLAPAPT